MLPDGPVPVTADDVMAVPKAKDGWVFAEKGDFVVVISTQSTPELNSQVVRERDRPRDFEPPKKDGP